MLVDNPGGHYRFLKGIDPYSCGAVAEEGYEIVHATLAQALPWREGFERIDAHLHEQGQGRSALCGVELRSPTPYTMEGFIGFNRAYCEVLKGWDLYVGDLNPVARTNVAPLVDPPAHPVLHGFSYTVACAAEIGRTLVVAGAGELQSRELVKEGIVRRGETTPDAMREKGSYVMEVMEGRLQGLGGSWGMVTMVDVYTVHPLNGLAEEMVLRRMGPAGRHGVRWYHARPPIVDIEFEMDLRGVRQEVWI